MISLGSMEEALNQVAHEKGWRNGEEGACFAVIAQEVGGEKTRIILYTIYDLNVEQVNQILLQQGFSNLAKVSAVVKVEVIPVMGTGKVNYRELMGSRIE